jgi:hypothetical protein
MRAIEHPASEAVSMKMMKTTSTAVLSLLLGIAAPVYAQHEQQDEKEDHPGQEQSKPEQARPQQHAQEQQPRQRSDQNKQQEHAQQQARSDQNKQQQHARQQQRSDQNEQQQHAQQRERLQPSQQQRHEQAAWQEHRARSWQSDHRNWQQRGGYNGYRIPDNRYRGYFGPDHGFRIYGLPFLVVGGYPRFRYQGYWFSAVDPWPEYWANDWYNTDDVYVTYVDNGYYLFNHRYPDVGIAINISM